MKEFLVLNYHGFCGKMGHYDAAQMKPRVDMVVEADGVRQAVRLATGFGGHIIIKHNFPEYNFCVVTSDPPPNQGGSIWVEVIERMEKNPDV